MGLMNNPVIPAQVIVIAQSGMLYTRYSLRGMVDRGTDKVRDEAKCFIGFETIPECRILQYHTNRPCYK